MASAVAMMVGGAIMNAFAFTGSNFLFSMLRDPGADEERKRHDQAIEQLQSAQAEWSRKRTERLDWIKEEMHRQGHAVEAFRDVDEAMREYNRVFGKNMALEPEPKLSEFYMPSPEQRDREIAFVIMGLGVTLFAAYYMLK